MVSAESDKVLAVPTNVITGFLGVGKTTAILALLNQKPEGERWAVLVNEFGEIGVDGSLVSGEASEEQGIYVREVPGGCMCCVSGLPMQIALAQLLRRAKPDRLLIEPTGLGHPIEVLRTLSSEHNREVIDLGPTITLVDARNLSDGRYVTHETFLQQLEIANVVVGNKEDLYTDEDQARLESFVESHCRKDARLVMTQQGKLSFDLLQGKPGISYAPAPENSHDHHHSTDGEQTLASDLPIPESGMLSASNEGEGFQSVGWRFAPTEVFERESLHAFFRGLGVERMKAVFITTDGIFGYNLTKDGFTETELDDCAESRIEIIADSAKEEWEGKLLSCRAE